MKLDNRLAKCVDELTPAPGVHTSNIKGLSLIKSCEVMTNRIPVIYEPCIYIVLQGKKSATLGDNEYIYDALNYLVLAVPLPLECRVQEASRDTPYLAVKIDIDKQMLSELIQEMEVNKEREKSGPKPGIFISDLGKEIKSTLSRILLYIKKPNQAQVLGKLAIKELMFYVLNGDQGNLLRDFVVQDRQNFQIAKVITFIQKHYSKILEVSDLANKANMSQSSFHSYFKSITGSSPIQYIKAIRLHAARRKILFNNLSASDAAFKVGYSSPSQFSREYKRFFGIPPTVDIQTVLNKENLKP
jgi:AraC-like DNA-binding protein